MPTIALDLDRVLFDTNLYLEELRERFKGAGLDFEEVAKRSAIQGRKDLSTMVGVVASKVGKARAEQIFFDGATEFWAGGAAEIFQDIRSRFSAVFVVTVGDGYQSRKIKGLDIDGIFVVDSDQAKVDVASALAEKYPNMVFVDDKASVVGDLSKQGVQAFQALWFLDPEHRKGALKNSLNKPSQLLDL